MAKDAWSVMTRCLRLSVWFVTLVIQSGAMVNYWTDCTTVYSQSLGENGRKTLSTNLHISWVRGRFNLILTTQDTVRIRARAYET